MPLISVLFAPASSKGSGESTHVRFADSPEPSQSVNLHVYIVILMVHEVLLLITFSKITNKRIKSSRIFGLYFYLHLYFVGASSDGYCESTHIRRLTRAFAARSLM